MEPIESIELDPTLAMDTVQGWVEQAISLAPPIVAALIVFALGYLIAAIFRFGIRRRFRSTGRDALGTMLNGLLKAASILGFGLIALTIVIPSLSPGDLVAGLGIGSVAIGFAFKDILQNWLSGFLILLRQPFRIGDIVEINDYEGNVETIEMRSTYIRTYNGERVIIPNAEVYSNSVKVRTAYEARRSEYDVGIGYGDSIDDASEAILQTLSEIDGVSKDPAPQVFTWDLAASWVTLRVRWWTEVGSVDIVKTRSNVLRAIKLKLDEHGIDMPYDTKVHLFHDQTDETDGLRGKQREGWPAPRQAETPRPRWKVEVDEKQKAAESKTGTEASA